jgi:hypothetical protein
VANYLAPGASILERLKELRHTWPTLAVLEVRDLAGVREGGERLPALHVLYLGDRFGDEGAGQGALLEVDQVWGVYVAVRDARQVAEAHVELGELISAVLERLQGWRPAGFAALRRVQAPGALYERGVVRVPLYFTCRVMSRGAL